jgi:phosphoglycolate phosphatase
MTERTRPRLPMPKALIFDWDNTLVDNWVTIGDAINAARTAFGHPAWSKAETLRNVRRSLRDSFPAMFGADWEEARRIFYETFEARHLETLRVIAGAEALLDGARARGLYLAVVSNKTGYLLRREAERLGWSPRFGALVGAGDAVRDKPAADPVHLALQHSGLTAGGDVWFVGDAPIDTACARAAGCTAVIVGNAHGEAVHDEMKPDMHVGALMELTDLVAGTTFPI